MSAVPDVLVVGSGPAGVSCAWPLVEAGLNVTLVDPGQSVSLPQPGRPSLSEVRSGTRPKHDVLLGEDLRALRFSAHPSPKLRVGAPAGFVADYYSQLKISTRDFVLAGTLATGGLSNVWGCVATAFDDADLAGMPISQTDLEPSYRAVASRIGISGTLDDDMGAFHGDVPLQPPLQLGKLSGLLLDRYARRGGLGDLRLGRSRNAVLSQPRPGRDACTLDAFCMWGCARGSVYNAAQDLAALRAYPNFHYARGCVADRIVRDADGYRVTGRDPANGEPVSHVGRQLVVAAGTVASTGLVLPFLGQRGIRRRLLNNPGYVFVLLLPEQLGRAQDKQAFAMAELSYALPLDDKGGYTTGLLYNAIGVSPVDVAEQMPLTLRGGLALHKAISPAIMLGLGYFDGAYSDNAMTVDDDATSTRIAIEGGWAPAFQDALAQTRSTLRNRFARLGAIMLPGSFRRLPPGGESHYAGTLSMGDLLTRDCEVVGAAGLYVVDGAAFGRLPAKHFTFGIMANADRVGRHMAAQHQRAMQSGSANARAY